MLVQFFIILLLGAVGSYYLGIKMQSWLLTMFSCVLFFVLAFQAFRIEVVTGGVSIVFQEIVLVALMWFGGFAATITTIYGMINNFRNRKDQPKIPKV